MHYTFDAWGWYAGAAPAATARSTPVAPPLSSTYAAEGEDRANWTGLQWIVLPYASPAGINPGPPVPTAVTMRQARLALHGAGKLAQVQAAIDALDEPERTVAQIAWDYSSEVQRSNGVLQGLAAALGMTDAEVDALFITAATL